MIESIALALAVAAMPSAQAAPQPACTLPLPTDCVQGSWTGQFAQAEWTFEFTRDGETWTGRYMSSRGKAWHPLQSLEVSGRTVRFSIASQPQLSFALTAGANGDTLAGDLQIAGHMTLPFSATRTR